jgi:hypothetical protein
MLPRRALSFITCLLLGLRVHAADSERVLADIPAGNPGLLKSLETVDCPDVGGKAGKLGQVVVDRPGTDWNAFTFLRLEVFNPNPDAATFQLCLKDGTGTHGYFSWVNRYVTVPAGKKTIEFQISALRRGEGSPKDALDPRPFLWQQLATAIFECSKGSLYVSRVSLAKVDLRNFAELRAFDFGPDQGGVEFLGFTAVGPSAMYAQDRGFGWVGHGAAWSKHRANPPDELVGDWISDANGVFRIDLPNGEYEGWAIMEDPGEWELYQNYRYRSLSVNGVAAIDEKMNGAQFLDRYFHFADVEDFPGDDLWSRYVAWRFPIHTFSFGVSDGKATVEIKGSGQYAATLNALVVYPKAKSSDGKAFLEATTERRRQSYAKAWTELVPTREPLDAAMAAKHKAQGYIAFQRPNDQSIGAFAAPKDDETRITLQATAAHGQSESLQFAIHALRDIEGLVVKPGAFSSSDGGMLPESAIRCGFVSYKIKRMGFGGQGQYGSVPRMVRPFAKDGVDAATSAKGGMARWFWTTVTVPSGQKAGTYTGSLVLSAKGAPNLKLPVSITVLPFDLPMPDMGMGVYGTAPSPMFAYDFSENQQRLDQDQARIFEDLAAHGMTLFEAWVALRGFAGGKAEWDTAAAERQAKRAKELGLSFPVVYASGTDAIATDPDAAARKHGFAGADAILAETFGAVNALFESRGLAKPVFCYGDEPGTAPEVERVSKMYSNVRKGGGRGYIAYSVHDTTESLLDLLGVSSLNWATRANIDRARTAGNEVWVNNQGPSRWGFGVWMWKLHELGVGSHQQFCYNGPHVDPYYALDGVEGEECMVFADRQGILRPTPDYERLRSGINDYRLLQLLKSLAKAKGAAGEAAWAPVAKRLDAIRCEDTKSDRRPQLSETQLDELRSQVVQAIVSLAK